MRIKNFSIFNLFVKNFNLFALLFLKMLKTTLFVLIIKAKLSNYSIITINNIIIDYYFMSNHFIDLFGSILPFNHIVIF